MRARIAAAVAVAVLAAPAAASAAARHVRVDLEVTRPNGTVTARDCDAAATILQQRLELAGPSGTVRHRQGARRITVEFFGLTNLAAALRGVRSATSRPRLQLYDLERPGGVRLRDGDFVYRGARAGRTAKGTSLVGVPLTPRGRRAFTALTGRIARHDGHLAVAVDGKVVYRPAVTRAVDAASVLVVAGTPQEAQALALGLAVHDLPTRLKVVRATLAD
jgi:preprotein translocase subunit SecD